MCAGTETLGGSSDLHHYPLQDAVRTGQRIGCKAKYKDPKMSAAMQRITSKLCPHSNLRTLQRLALRLLQTLRFNQQHLKGDRETALYPNVGLCRSARGQELSE
jgi:hypothetical protein